MKKDYIVYDQYENGTYCKNITELSRILGIKINSIRTMISRHTKLNDKEVYEYKQDKLKRVL